MQPAVETRATACRERESLEATPGARKAKPLDRLSRRPGVPATTARRRAPVSALCASSGFPAAHRLLPTIRRLALGLPGGFPTFSSCAIGAKAHGGEPDDMIRFASRAARGFTLVEMVITILIAAILVAIAVPNFRNLILSNRLTTTSNEIVDALNAARVEAVKLNAPVQFCSNSASANKTGSTDTLGIQCGTDATAIYMLPNGSSSEPVQVRAGVVGLAQQGSTDIQMHTLSSGQTITPVRFSGSGLGYAPGSTAPITASTIVDICAPSLSSDNHRQIAISAGSLIATTTTTGACP
jgi:type IV fimbrial biogenesis protein FimT